MSHQDAVTQTSKNFQTIGSTKESKFTAIENKKDKIYGIQFHPEVTHTENGRQIFKNFLYSICKIKQKWRVTSEKKIFLFKIFKKQ